MNINTPEVVNPEDASDGHGVVFALPVERYWPGLGAAKWDRIASARNKQVFDAAPILYLAPFDGNAPVGVARLAANAWHGGVYNDITEHFDNGQTAKRGLGVGEVTTRLAVREAITFSPRYAQRWNLQGRPGAFWESFDDFFSRTRDIIWLTNNIIPNFRFDGMISDYDTVASEAWVHNPNGTLRYFIFGNANQERSKAVQSFVVDPLNQINGDLLNGTCSYCHIGGVQSAPSDMAKAMESGAIDPQRLEIGRQFWSDQRSVSEAYTEDQKFFLSALKQIVLGISDGPASFNREVGMAANDIEPCYFTTSLVTGNRDRGNTAGKRHRPAGGFQNRGIFGY